MNKPLAIRLLMAVLSITTFAAEPKIAVTDLAYEETVSEYFKEVRASGKSSLKAKDSYSARDSDYSSSERGNSSVAAKSEFNYSYSEGVNTYIDRGELRKFTADVKGEMLKSQAYRVQQPKPYTAKNNEKLYDVIDRIKKGFFPGADYVLFGSINSMQWRDEANPLPGSSKSTQTLSLELVAEFSLVNTKTYEIKAAFSAAGEGQDVKILTGDNRVVMNRGKVVREVSQSLGMNVAQQLLEQFDPSAKKSNRRSTTTTTEIHRSEEVIILK
jgi:curli biogenesis system outer membrane secretion channel CsgG